MSGRQEILKCNICLSTMKDERMLPSCGHMFCLGCLQSYIGYKRDVQCPVCREKCRVPLGGVRDFPKNIYLNQFLDNLCEQCEKYPRTDRCPHCDQIMCAKCKDTHMADLRTELIDISTKVELMNDVRIIKESKQKKKILNDKQKNLEKELTKNADDLIKLIRNQEKKLKSQLKSGLNGEIKDIDVTVKAFQDDIATLKQFTKKYDVKGMPDEKMEEMKTKWTAHYAAIMENVNEDVTVIHKDATCTIDINEIETAISENWRLLSGDGSELSLGSHRLSVSSFEVPPSPNLQLVPVSLKNDVSLAFGGTGLGKGKFQSPFGITVSPVTGNIVVADTHNHRIQTFENNGQFIDAFGTSGSGNAQFAHPIGITCMKNGDHVIADTENHRIKIMDNRGKFVRSFGKEGSGVNDFRQPWGIAIDSTNQNIHIGDCGNNRIQVMNIYGRYIRTIGRNELKSPTGIAIDTTTNDDIYVADCDNHRVVVYSKYGTQKRTFGSEGTKEGQLSSPCDLVLDHEGHVVVAEWGNHRVQVFTKEGRSLRILGRKGSAKGELKEPRGVAIGTDGTIVVCDCGNDRVQKF